MLKITQQQFNGTTAQLQARVQEFLAAKQAHLLTVGVPAPREIELVEALAASGEAFEVLPPPEDPAPPVAPTLAQLRALALGAIDQQAGRTRMRYITAVAGQEATYLIKERQAEAFAAAAYGGTVPPMVQAEVDATGLTAQQACDAILAERDAWVVKAAQIEKARRAGKLAVAAAADEAAVEASRDTAIAELAAL